jgi:Zn-dependent protease with chaperone function
MNSKVSYRVETKENVYFAIGLVFSVVFYAVVVTGLIMSVDMGMEAYLGAFAFYAVVILVLLHVMGGLLVGMIRGNAVKLGPEQFPDIHATVLRQSQQLGLGRVPDVYLLQAGGVLNAFATRFMGTDFIVLYSDILEEAYEQNRETVDFVIAHELGHVKRCNTPQKLDSWLRGAKLVRHE